MAPDHSGSIVEHLPADEIGYVLWTKDALADGVNDTEETVRGYLEHVDLIHFDDRDVMEYDPFADRVRPGPHFASVLAVIEAVDELLGEEDLRGAASSQKRLARE